MVRIALCCLSLLVLSACIGAGSRSARSYAVNGDPFRPHKSHATHDRPIMQMGTVYSGSRFMSCIFFRDGSEPLCP